MCYIITYMLTNLYSSNYALLYHYGLLYFNYLLHHTYPWCIRVYLSSLYNTYKIKVYLTIPTYGYARVKHKTKYAYFTYTYVLYP